MIRSDSERPDNAAPIQFTLRELLIAVTVVGVLLGVLRAAGIFGAVFAFLATVLFTFGIYPSLRRKDLRAQQSMFDFLWGVGMPLICLIFDPFVFKESSDFDPFGFTYTLGEGRFFRRAFFVYPFAACQMVAMTVWLVLGSRAGKWSLFLGGFLTSGLLFASLVGMLLALPAAVGVMFAGIGLLGLTPLIATFSYGRQCGRALSGIWPAPTQFLLSPLALLGFTVSAILPVLLGLALLAAVRGPDAVGELLRDL